MLVLPWLLRNYILLDSFNISSGRPGKVLLARAVYNDVGGKDYYAFLLSTASKLTHRFEFLNKLIINSHDPQLLDRAYNFKYRYEVKKIVRKKIQDVLKTHQIGKDSDYILGVMAKRMIMEDLKTHIMMILTFMVEASFPEMGYGFIKKRRNNNIGKKYHKININKYYTKDIITNLFFIISFYFILFYSIFSRKWEYTFFILPTLYFIGMYAVFVYINKRFMVPTIPIYVVSFCIVISCVYERLKKLISCAKFVNNR